MTYAYNKTIGHRTQMGIDRPIRVVVYKTRSRWVVAKIYNGVAEWSGTYGTKAAAVNKAESMTPEKKANPYRKTTRNGIPVYVSTTTGRIVKGPGLKRTAKRLVGAIKHSVKRTVKRVVKAVKNPTVTTARHFGSLFGQEGNNKQAAWSKFLAWARGAGSAMPTDPAQRQSLKRAFMIEWERSQKYRKNPGAGFKAVYKGRTIGYFSTAAKAHAAVARAKKADGKEEKSWQKYTEMMRGKNPKRKTAAKAPTNGTAVGKSKYKTTMDAAAKLMPFPSKVVKSGDAHYLYVKRHNVAAARKILNAMAKTVAKTK